MSIRPLSLAALAAAASLAVLASGCSAQTASAPIDQQTLTLLHIDGGTDLDPAVGWLIDAVAERSDGAITIELVPSCCGDGVDVEEKLVASIAAGDAELGWVGTRVFAELGVDSLRALTAPFVIDGYALEQAALESTAANDALAAVGDLEVTPLALVPGSIRYPLAAAEAVVSLNDWAGLAIASFHSEQNADSLTALGAEPLDVTFEERDAGIYDGTIGALENSLIMQDLGREHTLPYATVDVGLWPRSSALIANSESSAASGAVAAVLKQAAADVVGMTAELGELDAAAMASSCADGARFALAGASGRSAMEDAAQQELDAIAANESAAPLLEALLAIADEHEGEVPPIPAGCDGDAPATAVPGSSSDAAVVNGRFQTVAYTEQQLLDAGFTAEDAKNAAAQFTLVFQDGGFELIAQQGTQTFGCDGEYAIDGDQIVVEYFPGGDCGPGGVFFSAVFVVDDQSLTFPEIDAQFDSDEYLFGSAPLTRVG